MGEVAKYRNGKAHENCIDESGKYIVVNSKFVSTNGTVIKHSNMQNEPLAQNEIAFVLSDVPNGRAIARTFLVEENDKYTLNQRIAGITSSENTYPYFLHILMNRHPYFLAFDDGVKQTNLSVSDVLNFETYYPEYEEQKQIGEYFRNLDRLITLHQRKCQIDGCRFQSPLAITWEQRKLSEICQVTMGQSPDGSTYSETPSDYILVQGNADLKEGWVSPRIWTTQKTKTADVGDLIMSVRAPAGSMGKTSYNVVLGRGVAGIKGNEFIYQSLVKMDSDGYWKKLAAGSTFESINSDVVNGADLMVPQDIDEQNKIGDYFSSIDTLITLHQCE